MVRPRIAYAGVPGAYAEIACHTFRPDHDPIGRPGFAEAIAAVEAGQVEMAAIPTRNTVAGPVPGVADLLDNPALQVVGENDLDIAVHCLGLTGVSLDAIDTVRSHPVALRQCGEFLARHDWREIEDVNTAVAAMTVHNCDERHCAVLASERTAQLYGLEILVRDVQDRRENRTSFAFVVRA
ncbi:MAG: prephenate dehydratase [Sphingomonadales bacterium CG12_big_fil_rev_8_21_14_0_65_65_10]|uniref:prephenate dehydratase n=1 Tax=Blastomonas marina TaxID=1867408 RepID=A0ABQ1FGG1_9SPHN|nr:prephenate dehydratase domain-containing protein [Blastomonas marina]PIW54955.1 MAG: prephenate dehydratase [Sphingomonadales bacterium CG12_big_fil_rev_8_21_14_0_65_65_10]GGA10876.1 hypothetical protein GCM10010923_21820 [Blastomonas marina]